MFATYDYTSSKGEAGKGGITMLIIYHPNE